MKKTVFVLLALLVAVIPGAGALAQGDDPVTTRSAPPDPAGVMLVPVADGFDRPLYLTNAGDGSGRLFVLEQTGRVQVIAEGERLATPFLDLSGLVTPINGYSEQGLLGLVFHPDYAANGRFFVSYTDRNGSSVVAEYAVSADDPNVADPDSRRVLLTVEQPYANHNGGMLAFGPDGYLYLSLGDGGSAGDPQANGQNPWTLLGSILRLDVDTPPQGQAAYSIPVGNPYSDNGLGLPELWAIGLRNVWRFSFDRATGDLYLADVGQDQWEEVNFQAAGFSGGANYGWNRYEGTHSYSGGEAPRGMVLPIAEYSHAEGGCSITGGYVYRGADLPDLDGVYFFGDWCLGNIWATYRDEAGDWQTNLFMPQSGHMITSFGEDEAGELYVMDYSGSVWRFGPAA